MTWKRYDVPGWHGRKDYIKLNTKAIYVPQWTLINLFKNVRYVQIWYDADEKAISLRPMTQEAYDLNINQGVAIANYKKHGNIGTSLARVIPRGWYIHSDKSVSGKDEIFVLGKEEDAVAPPIVAMPNNGGNYE